MSSTERSLTRLVAAEKSTDAVEGSSRSSWLFVSHITRRPSTLDASNA
jgi:hypothetical protein